MASHFHSRIAGRALVAGAMMVALSACATMPTPRNADLAAYQPQQASLPYGVNGPDGWRKAQAARAGLPTCRAPEVPAMLARLTAVAPESWAALPELLAPGDRVKVEVAGDKDQITAPYVVAANGALVVGPVSVQASGRTRVEVEGDLRARLIALNMIRDVASNLRLSVVQAAGVTVSVEGAVFDPGQVLAGERSDPNKASVVDHPAGGDFNGGRTLSSALRAAGGLRPDAAMDAVWLVRAGAYTRIDESAAIDGGMPADPQLTAGDRVIVGSAGCFQPRMVRPTSVTAPGIRVFMSNLTRPANHNAGSAIGRDSTSLPYGTRFLQGLVAANCVGGSILNAQRHAILISRNPMNGRIVVIQRSIEQLVRNANRDDLDPWLMPGDSLACYDSTAASIADMVSTLGSAATPAALVKSLSN